jgi:hypothetical protein
MWRIHTLLIIVSVSLIIGCRTKIVYKSSSCSSDSTLKLVSAYWKLRDSSGSYDDYSIEEAIQDNSQSSLIKWDTSELRFQRKYFLQFLKRYNEEDFYSDNSGDEKYRLIIEEMGAGAGIMRGMTVREGIIISTLIHTKDSLFVTTKVWDTNDKVIKDIKKKPISLSELETFYNYLHNMCFWQLESHDPECGYYHDVWTLEEINHNFIVDYCGKYHRVEIAYPGGSYFEGCNYLLKLSGIDTSMIPKNKY